MSLRHGEFNVETFLLIVGHVLEPHADINIPIFISVALLVQAQTLPFALY